MKPEAVISLLMVFVAIGRVSVANPNTFRQMKRKKERPHKISCLKRTWTVLSTNTPNLTSLNVLKLPLKLII